VSARRPEEWVVRPLTTQFVKRQPRLTKPLEMKKRPRPKHRPIRRQMVSVKAKATSGRTASAFEAPRIIEGLSQVSIAVGRSSGYQDAWLDPRTLANAIGSTREPQHLVDTSLEMVAVDDLDTGRYRAMVIQDPNDKHSIRGYFHLNIVHSHAYVAMSRAYHTQMFNCINIAIGRLVEALNTCTAIRADIGRHVYLDSDEMFTVPWYFLSSERPFKLGDVESDYLGRYLLQGGFFILDYVDHFACFPKGALSSILQEAMASQGLVRGQDWNLEFLPKDHPLFHCFFDFDEEPFGRVPPDKYRGWEKDRYLKGLLLQNRLVALYSSRGYGNVWGDWGPGGGYGLYAHLNPARHIQFGLNTIIFALTQEGSITKRVMDTVQ